MNSRKLLFALGGLMLNVSYSVQANDCDFLIAQFNQKPVAVIDPSPTGNNSDQAMQIRTQALGLFASGHQQCSNGQPVEGAATLQQAIDLLQTL